MNLKRIAGVINLLAAVVFIGLGVRNGNTVFMVIGGFFLLIGILRLRQTSAGPPSA
jgi:hypothetical protein